jgi:hypothetical protein
MLRSAQKARLEARTASTLRGRQATYVECGDLEARAVVAGRFGFRGTAAKATSPLSPQKDQGCREAKGTSPGVEGAPPLEQAARFS